MCHGKINFVGKVDALVKTVIQTFTDICRYFMMLDIYSWMIDVTCCGSECL